MSDLSLSSVLPTVEARAVWIGNSPSETLRDRNLCTRGFLVGIARRQAYFMIRQHASMPYEELEELKQVGDSPTGKVFQQDVMNKISS